MSINYTQVKNPVWANTEKTQINCDVLFDHLAESDGFVGFTACPNDSAAHGRKIYAEALAGDYGVITDYVPPPAPTSEQLAINIRSQREGLLMASDWTQLPDVPQATKELWATYRQALRDITGQSGFPQSVTWPTSPE